MNVALRQKIGLAMIGSLLGVLFVSMLVFMFAVSPWGALAFVALIAYVAVGAWLANSR